MDGYKPGSCCVSLRKTQWECEMKTSSMTSHRREGRGCGATWKQKKSRLVTGGINNSECSISKVEFYEAPEDKVTPERENNAEFSSFMGGGGARFQELHILFCQPSFLVKEGESLRAKSKWGQVNTQRVENLVLMYFIGIEGPSNSGLV